MTVLPIFDFIDNCTQTEYTLRAPFGASAVWPGPDAEEPDDTTAPLGPTSDQLTWHGESPITRNSQLLVSAQRLSASQR